MSVSDMIVGTAVPLSVQFGAPRAGGGGGGGGGGGPSALYGATGGSSPSNLYTIDPATGLVATTVGPIGFALTGMAYDHTTNTMYGSTSSLDPTASCSLITVDLTTGAGTLIGLLTPPGSFDPVADLACDSLGNLFGWIEGPDGLASIDKGTGVATLLGATYGTRGDGESFDAADVLYDMSTRADGELWTVDTTTGVRTVVATLSGYADEFASVAAAAFGPDASRSTLYAVMQDSGTCFLTTVDTTTGEVTTIGQAIDKLDALEWVY